MKILQMLKLGWKLRERILTIYDLKSKIWKWTEWKDIKQLSKSFENLWIFVAMMATWIKVCVLHKYNVLATNFPSEKSVKDHTQIKFGSSSSIFLLQHIWRTAAETREAQLIIGPALSSNKHINNEANTHVDVNLYLCHSNLFLILESF